MSAASRKFRREQLRREAACPDCKSNVRVKRGGGGLDAQVSVAHDSTCPWFREVPPGP
jgi:hypothetical protein